jgi:hypothetical protein
LNDSSQKLFGMGSYDLFIILSMYNSSIKHLLKKKFTAGRVAHMVEYLPSKHEALSSEKKKIQYRKKKEKKKFTLAPLVYVSLWTGTHKRI